MGKKCAFEPCNNPARTKGLCSGHYGQKLKGRELTRLHGSLTNAEFFHTRIARENGCWTWTGKKMKSGYGVFKYQGIEMLAHRYSWELHRGPLSGAELIDHLCHNRACVNPDHLRVATYRENSQNLIGARRNSKTGKRGVIFYPKKNRYAASVRRGEEHYRKYFKTEDEAEAAAQAKREEWFTVPGKG